MSEVEENLSIGSGNVNIVNKVRRQKVLKNISLIVCSIL